jgi:hypothetical protein
MPVETPQSFFAATGVDQGLPKTLTPGVNVSAPPPGPATREQGARRWAAPTEMHPIQR